MTSPYLDWKQSQLVKQAQTRWVKGMQEAVELGGMSGRDKVHEYAARVLGAQALHDPGIAHNDHTNWVRKHLLSTSVNDRDPATLKALSDQIRMGERGKTPLGTAKTVTERYPTAESRQQAMAALKQKATQRAAGPQPYSGNKETYGWGRDYNGATRIDGDGGKRQIMDIISGRSKEPFQVRANTKTVQQIPNNMNPLDVDRRYSLQARIDRKELHQGVHPRAQIDSSHFDKMMHVNVEPKIRTPGRPAHAYFPLPEPAHPKYRGEVVWQERPSIPKRSDFGG